MFAFTIPNDLVAWVLVLFFPLFLFDSQSIVQFGSCRYTWVERNAVDTFLLFKREPTKITTHVHTHTNNLILYAHAVYKKRGDTHTHTEAHIFCTRAYFSSSNHQLAMFEKSRKKNSFHLFLSALGPCSVSNDWINILKSVKRKGFNG